MRKGVGNRKLILVLSLVLLFSLFLSINFVSANIFGDFFNNLFEKNQVDLSPQSCQNDWECPIGQNCNTGYCGTPIACDPKVSINFNPKCPAQDVCNLETSICQQGECQKNTDCISPFNICENALCVQKSCSSDSECPKTYNNESDLNYLNPKCMAGICVQPMCNTDSRITTKSMNFSACGTNPNNPGVCFNYLCLKKQCVDNSQCSSDRVCNNGLCFRSECNINSDCGDEQACINNICKDVKCKSDSNCGFGSICDSNFQCVLKPCSTDSVCGTDSKGKQRYCFNALGYCSLPQCTGIKDCSYGAGLVCNGLECSNTCNSNTDCSHGYRSANQYQCVNHICCANGVCPNIEKINNEICSDGKDNNLDGLTDYADPQCISECVSPKIITSGEIGKGAGRATLIFLNEKVKGCCETNQCYYSKICANNGGVVSLNSGINNEGNYGNFRETEVCSVNGSSAVWCKQGFENDGNGNCVASVCTPQCSGKTCGSWSDGCGGTINCGVCSSGQTCNSNGQCITIQQCTPQCSGKNCGANNGCGGVCAIGSGCTTTTTISCSWFKPCPRIMCIKAPCPTYTCVSNKCVMK